MTSNREMIFRGYPDDWRASHVGSEISKSGLPVTDDLFSVGLDVDEYTSKGHGLWLAVEVGRTQIGRREIRPVRYT